jgi:hypothetical protein
MNNPDHISLSLENIFLALMRIRDGKNSDPGWKKVGSGSGIRDKHPGSATMGNEADA